MARYNNRGHRGGGHSQEKGNNANAAPASIIGEPFHNPYTFIPFPEDVERYLPTPLTADERLDERHRQSGVLEIQVKTLSPLLTCSPNGETDDNDHTTYKALTIGDDVIVPATGIRGGLRTLLTVISGGTLGYLDEDLWLTQGRDAQLGPSQMMQTIPNHAFLAKVIKPGSSTHDGTIQLGTTKLIKVEELENQLGRIDIKRPTTGDKQLIYKDSDGEWEVKLSGRPIKRRGKKEGLFQADGEEIPLNKVFWGDYQGRHRHAVRKQLRQGDLVWLEPRDPQCEKITSAQEIKSLQWARWGRHGKKLIDRLPHAVIPDYLRSDDLVDMVSDIFGQVHATNQKMTFSGRVRPGNLIFKDATNKLKAETLAPLATPHPGCVAFYGDSAPDELMASSPLKGYKVYRNTQERGDNAPWKYSVQGIYIEQGELKMPEQQLMNKTAELLDEGCVGTLKIAFRALAEEELSLLLAAMTVDWKLGGGKPLGLGHCRVISAALIDEKGYRNNPMAPETDNNGNLTLTEFRQQLVAHLKDRIALYRTSQKPVKRLRYPRAVTKNQNKSNRAGLSWFARHASLKKTGKGLETLWTTGQLKAVAKSSQIKAQGLPPLDANNPDADQIYGYDMVELDVDITKRGQRLVGRIEPFDPTIHASEEERAGDNLSQNRETRQAHRDARNLNDSNESKD